MWRIRKAHGRKEHIRLVNEAQVKCPRCNVVPTWEYKGFAQYKCSNCGKRIASKFFYEFIQPCGIASHARDTRRPLAKRSKINKKANATRTISQRYK
jgi:DNA-directed RNA polymerase subunit RPC12/RpoP